MIELEPDEEYFVPKGYELITEREWFEHPTCWKTKVCQETESFKGTEHEGLDMCEDGCVRGTPCLLLKLKKK